MARTLSDIDKQIEQLKAQRQKIVVKEAHVKRSNETRQKTILGGWLMAHNPSLTSEIIASLRRPQDRAAFGLETVSDAQGSSASHA